MKKAGKFILPILLSILILIAAVYYFNRNTKIVKPVSASVISNKDSSANKDTPIKSNVEDLKKDNKNIIPEVKQEEYSPLKILGISNKLSKSQNDSMNSWRESILGFSKNNSDSVYINGRSKEKLVSLTFDDCPDAKITPQILKILKDNNISASFCVMGDRAKMYPGIVKQIFDQGNLVLNHSYTHPQFTKISESKTKDEILSTENEINKIIGKRPAIIRPPYGDINDAVIKLCTEMDYKIVIWSIDSMDWSQQEDANIVKNVVDNIRPGDIILMHSNEGKTADVKALPVIISRLKEKGYKFQNLSEMLNIKAYKN